MSDYTPGKLDWFAAGLPIEGSRYRRVGDVARADVPTCTTSERLGDVAERVRAAGWNACVVVNEERVVFGLLRAKELDGDPEQVIEQAMRPGPSTFRPHVPVAELARYMGEHDLENSPITSSDGRLIGLLLREDAESAAHEEHAHEH